MKRRHVMPFGAALEDGGVRFRIWAPAATRVRVCLGDGARGELDAVGGGFFEGRLADASAGTRYGFQIDDDPLVVPDPASRSNPDDVHGLSAVVDPEAFDWRDDTWCGRPWNEAVIYECHVGTFSDTGRFTGVQDRLDYLAELGVTALELMPVAEFSGARGWGYDGVLPFAPECGYGRPEDLKRLVQAAHARGLMVFLDVVYNHFGPEGNYLHRYAPQAFTDRVETPWGEAIEFEGEAGRPVRELLIHNALYWLEEFNLDGLRLDAVHAIHDRSRPDVLEELSQRVRAATPPDRHVHLVLENDDNAAHYLRPESSGGGGFTAQWNDDFHHVAHVLLTGEHSGYYGAYAGEPMRLLGRCLTEGFAWQGEWSSHRNRRRGEPSADLDTGAFVHFLQNHDQVGNRAFGERLAELAPEPALAAADALLLLAPQPPLLFMGEEFAASSRFPFFCEFPEELGVLVAAGRRREFAHFPEFADPEARQRIPDPNALETFRQARLRWPELDEKGHRRTLERYRRLLSVRHRWLMPRLPGRNGRVVHHGERALTVQWHLADGARWNLLVNLGEHPATVPVPEGRWVHGTGDPLESGRPGTLPPWAVAAFLQD